MLNNKYILLFLLKDITFAFFSMNNISSPLQPIFQMKKTLFALAALLLSIAFLQAQNDIKPLEVKFGKLSDEEIKMTQYDKDPDAGAVVLFDKGNCTIGKNNLFTQHIRIKIFKKTAIEQGNFTIELPNWASISGIRGITYNLENGKMVETKLTKENMFDEKITKFWNLKKIIMPDIHEGSIIELEYNISGGYLGDWTFQHIIPTMWSEYKMSVPKVLKFSQIGQGTTPYLVSSQHNDRKTYSVVTQESLGRGFIADVASKRAINNNYYYDTSESFWIQKDIPAFQPEKFITSSADYLTKLNFYLEEYNPEPGFGVPQKYVKSWAEEAKELLYDNDFYGIIDKKSVLKDELVTVVNDGMKPKEKVQAIFNYIGKTFEQNKGRSLFLSGTVSELQKKGKLTPSEMNILMMNMIRTAGIEVHPVLISTRKHGKIGTPYAVYNRFDRTIGRVLIDKDTFFIDVASYPHPVDLLPFEDLNGGGYEFWGKENYAVVIPSNKIATRRMSQGTMILDTEGWLSGTIATTTSGYEAVENRQNIKEMGVDKFVQSMLSGVLISGKLEEQKFENPEAFYDGTLKGNFKIKTTDYVSKAGDKMYINPLLCFAEKTNAFANPERKFTIDYGSPKDEVANLILTIPDGYKVEELPKMVRIQLFEGAMRYDYLIEASGNQIRVNTKLSIKKTTYEVAEYPDLRDFYGKIIAKMGEQIVLTKVTK